MHQQLLGPHRLDATTDDISRPIPVNKSAEGGREAATAATFFGLVPSLRGAQSQNYRGACEASLVSKVGISISVSASIRISVQTVLSHCLRNLA